MQRIIFIVAIVLVLGGWGLMASLLWGPDKTTSPAAPQTQSTMSAAPDTAKTGDQHPAQSTQNSVEATPATQRTEDLNQPVKRDLFAGPQTKALLAQGQVGKLVHYQMPPRQDYSKLALPRNEAGHLVITELAGGTNDGELAIDPNKRDPLTALGACAAWISGCFSVGERTLDDCSLSAPKCQTNEPWLEDAPCCPTACYENYAARRLAGSLSITAFETTYFNQPTCFPGVSTMLPDKAHEG